MKKHLVIGATLFAALSMVQASSAHANSVPVMIVQLESNAQGIKVLSEEVKNIEYKKSRSDEKAKKSGKFQRARSGGWVAQIIRADGTVESEQAIEDPREQHGEFSYDGARANERIEVQAESGVFTVQIPVTSEEVTLRIVHRQSHPVAASLNEKAVKSASQNVSDEDTVKGEFKLKEHTK
jgi:opacity protein-like surface antigen